MTNLVSGESDQTIDAGIIPTSHYRRLCWNDTDGDGVQDPTETGLKWCDSVILKDAGISAVPDYCNHYRWTKQYSWIL
ncbi:MAG: hypothetical protein IPJ43_19375 [Saprospiraceae bacterium]|nr:hypothetical protein [Saprospiraceae bacterium]